jgi:hypothetical protein
MSTQLQGRSGKVLNSLYLMVVFLFAIAIAYNHLQIVTHEYTLDYNETGMLVTTATIAEGGNPYSLESQPIRISLYPVLYNILVAPLSRVLGNTLELHRAVNGFFILASCAICFYLCRRVSGTRTESFTAAVLVYAGLLVYSTPIASINGLGLFLFLGAITVPWMDGFSTRSLAVSIVLGLLAFYTKQYFIACLGYVALYLFLADSRKRAIYFSLAALAAFIAVLAIVTYTSPYYLEATVFAVQSSAGKVASDEHLMTQVREFVQIYLPLMVILLVAVVDRIYSAVLSSRPGGRLSGDSESAHAFNPGAPRLRYKANYIWVCCACSVIIIVLALGKNRGNHLTYFFQLISPFLLVGIFALVSGMPKWRWPFRILILIALYNSYVMLPADFSVKEESWRRVKTEIASANEIYASTLVLQYVLEKGAPVYLSGGTRYFVVANDKPSFMKDTHGRDSVPEIWERYVTLIRNKIQNREFDLLLIDNWMPFPASMQDSEIGAETLLESMQNIRKDTEKQLTANYKMTAEITLPLVNRPGGGNFQLQIWKPIEDIPQVTVEPSH